MKKFCLCIALLFIGTLLLSGCASDDSASHGTLPDASTAPASTDLTAVETIIKTVSFADYDVLDLGGDDAPADLGTAARATGDYSVTIDNLDLAVTFKDGSGNTCILNPVNTLNEEGDLILYETADLTETDKTTLGTVLAAEPTTYFDNYYFPAVWYKAAAQTTPVDNIVSFVQGSGTDLGAMLNAIDTGAGLNLMTGDPTGVLPTLAVPGWGTFSKATLEAMWDAIEDEPYSAAEQQLDFKLEKGQLPLIIKWPASMSIVLSGSIYGVTLTGTPTATVTFNTTFVATVLGGIAAESYAAALIAGYGITDNDPMNVAILIGTTIGAVGAPTGVMPLDNVDLGTGTPTDAFATVSFPTLNLELTAASGSTPATGIIISNNGPGELGSDFICKDISADTPLTFTVSYVKDYDASGTLDADERIGKNIYISFYKDGTVEAIFTGTGAEDTAVDRVTVGRLIYDLSEKEGIYYTYDGAGQVTGAYDVSDDLAL